MEIKIKKLKENAIIPTRGSAQAAGYDLYACLNNLPEITILPHKSVKVGTGLAIQPPKGYWGMIAARSGTAYKKGLRPANCIGVCDEDYRGEYMVAVHNVTDCEQKIANGERFAQIVFLPYINAEMVEETELDDTKRGSGGFGSTGTK